MAYDLAPWLQRMAGTSTALMGGQRETVSYVARSTAQATPVSYLGVVGWSRQVAEHTVAMASLAGGAPVVQRGDEELSVLTAAVLWTPTIWDSVLRGDAAVPWRVLGWENWPHGPVTMFRIRRIP